ncbi:unnamed protein product [Menidia menidia]|uniref:(Atlantic silverside) hypothetical protein n=1 Tax=Menidia menidia TaxID=238744 RepID=A0A8S4AKG3_9TELE|nr:unnamed protein product [Menidia menidia]
MKAADEPAYLTVGTDVSAKYRGAFCEAKIKTVKRMVKVKVTLKGDSTSQVVQDDQVKGPLRVGSTVEVKTNEGLCSEAVIGKLTDASLYTVVFDDGDEKTLRRTSLCLKGERHFAESETLDQLPLTNPEHFGTPVIGKKSNRGGRRSSQAVADEENDTSSSEDEEFDRRRLNDELLGKICSIENVEDSCSWFLALVVSPSCNDELMVKKDQCLVRSFCDGKFCIVARRHVHPVNSMSIIKSEFFSRKGLEEAQIFLKTREVPDAWKMDMSQILDSSSGEDEVDEKESDEEEEEDAEAEKKKKHIKEEPEEEADPEERDHFLQQLYKFMEDRGTPINKPPVLGYKDLNLFKLFRLVYHLGGCHKIESGTVWKQVYIDLGIPVLNSAASYNVKTAYRKYLYGFEEYCRSASITFRTIHHNNPHPHAPLANPKKAKAEPKEASAPQVKVEPVDDKREEAETGSESEKEMKDRQSSPRGRRRCVGSRMKLPSRPENVGLSPAAGGENSEEKPREARRRSNRRMDDSEKGSDDEEEDDDEEEEEEEEDDDDDDDDDEEEEEEEEEEGGDELRKEDRSEDGEDGDSVTGTKVKVKYGKGKTQKIYEAHIKKTDMDNGEQFYLVHYYGWNVRYDEWVKADRIIWPPEKGTKKRQRKKVKNRDTDEPEKDEEKPASLAAVKAKRGRPQIRTSSMGRSGSKAPSSEGQSNGKSSRMDSISNLTNGDDTPRRRTRRTSAMYDSDRASNEDSGNSSDGSESEDKADAKPLPWRGRTDGPPCKPEEELEEEEEEELEEEDTSEISDVAAPASDNSSVATAKAPPAPTVTPCPSISQETADEALDQSERRESKQREEPELEAEVAPTPPEKEKKACVLRTDKLSPGQEGLREASPSRTPPPASSSPAAHDPGHSTPVSSPRVKDVLSPPRGVLKRQEEPMVVLHCLPAPHAAPKTPPATSDTDSATEEEGGEEERGGAVMKRKAAEQRTVEKKLCPDRRPEEASPAKPPPPRPAPPQPPPPPPCPPGSSEGQTKAQDCPRLVGEKPEEHASEAKQESEVTVGAPPLLTEGPGPNEELEPQIGPEALVCHEVDLDDPDEREKPAPSPEHLLLMMREPQIAPPPLPLAVHSPPPPHQTAHLPQPQIRPYLIAAPCSEELHQGKAAAEEERGAGGGGQEGGCSPGFEGSASSSSTSLLSLQESKDRGQKRVNDCGSSPSAKKHKRNQKRPHPSAKLDKNGAGHSSDSEDQVRLSLSKSQKSRCPGFSPPAAHNKDKPSFPSHQRSYKWTLQLDELDGMSSAERISFLQEKLQEIRKYYMSLKSEVASIDRRRKRLKKKEREVSHTTASTSSGSSDTGMSPSSASPTQNTVAVECR